MLRSLSIRNFVVVEALDVEFDAGFTVLTGETGAGKSILLDALGLILGDRFEQGQLRPGADRAELAAVFDVAAARSAQRWLADAARFVSSIQLDRNQPGDELEDRPGQCDVALEIRRSQTRRRIGQLEGFWRSSDVQLWELCRCHGARRTNL